LALRLVLGLFLQDVPDDQEYLVGEGHQRLFLGEALCPTMEACGKDRLVSTAFRKCQAEDGVGPTISFLPPGSKASAQHAIECLAATKIDVVQPLLEESLAHSLSAPGAYREGCCGGQME
jgi:hypothetical protein